MNEQQPEHKTLDFSKGLLGPTLRGEKEITFRLYDPERHYLQEGEIFVGNFFTEGIQLALQTKAETQIRTFSSLDDEVAQEDGFVDAIDAYEKMGRFYNGLTFRSEIAIIRYEIPRIQGLVAVRSVLNTQQVPTRTKGTNK